MRPLYLEFCAFGSYPGREEVDFTLLEPKGLFVVTGDTGTGKTTILDAICYAIYGEMPGKPANDIRSHHAQAEDKTYVRLRFEIGSEEYVVERSPAYSRPKQRGAGTTEEKAQVSLVRMERDGSTTSLATKAKEVHQECEKLIGLTASQFQKVLLLPQGEFQKFLLDDSSGREQILSNLFDGALYQEIVKALQDGSKALQHELGTIDTELDLRLTAIRQYLQDLYKALEIDFGEVPEDVGLAQLEELLHGIQSNIEALNVSHSRAVEDTKQARELEADARRLAGSFDEAERLNARIKELDSQEEQVKKNLERSIWSKRARVFVEAWKGKASSETNFATADLALGDRLESITQVAKSFATELDTSSAQSIVETIGSHRDTLRQQQKLLANLNEAKRTLENLDSELENIHRDRRNFISQRERAEERLREIGRRPVPEVVKKELDTVENALAAIPDLTNLNDEVAKKEQQLSEKRQIFEGDLELFLQTEAPRLAQNLRDGDPCPVCGSLSHPSPALAASGEVVDYERVGEAKAELDRVDAELKEISGNRQKLLDLFGDLKDLSLENLEIKRDQLLTDTALLKEIAGHDEVIFEISAKVLELDGKLAALEDGRREASQKLEEAEQEASKVDPILLAQLSTALEEIAPLLEGLTDLFSKVLAENIALRRSQDALSTAESESGFADIDVARQALVDPSKEEEWIDADEQHRRSNSDATRDLEKLRKDGVPDQRPDVTRAEADTRVKVSIESDLLTKKAGVDILTKQLGRAILELNDLHQETGDLRDRFELAKRAHKVCSGQGHEKINLSRWILGRELDRIVDAATVRLRKMTSGRYSLQRKSSSDDGRVATGLDIEVLDSHTGRPRSPTSLSGGEQFQASLALALGLADVVSQGGTGSGKHPQALFIDEGFGSLDPKALDDVIDTLHQLQATGRLVGAVTHVPEMKERLHQGITVTRRPDGRGSTLQVHA